MCGPGELPGILCGRSCVLRLGCGLLRLGGACRGGGLLRGRLPGGAGLWTPGGLLRLLRLPGDLPGVLLHLLPLLEQLLHRPGITTGPCLGTSLSPGETHIQNILPRPPLLPSLSIICELELVLVSELNQFNQTLWIYSFMLLKL